MKYLNTLITLFVIGSMLGYIIEVLYKRFISIKKWTNTGLMLGPYLPIYGFGTIILYGLSSVISSRLIVPKPLEVLVVLITFFMLLTLLEFLTGLFLLKKFNLRLWDYSSRRLNVKGLICARYSIYWTILGVSYYYLLHPLFMTLVNASLSSLILRVVLSSILVVIIIDAYNTFNISKKLSSIKVAINNQVNLIASYYSVAA